MKNKEIKSFIIIAIILIIFASAYFLLDNYFSKKTPDYEEYLKNYEVNEYISTYISDEEMAKIYYNDYIKKTYYNIEDAYNLLDTEYKEKKFGNIENFKNYIYTNTNFSNKFSKYYKTTSNEYIIFGVYDENNNLYIFKTKGVMQYKVYLDDYTVEYR